MTGFLKRHNQVIFLYGSTLVGVILGIFVSILNTSYLTPSEFGDVRYVNNLMSFFSGLLMFGFFVSGCRLLAISKNVKNNERIKGVMVIILLISVIVMMLAMLISAYVHYKWLNKNITDLFMAGITISSAPLLLNYINTTAQGENDIKSISLARLLPSLIYLLLGYIIYNNFGATSVRVILIQNGLAVLIIGIIILLTKPDFKKISLSYKKLLIENKKYGFQVYLGSLAGVSLSYLAGITLGIFNSDNTQVGFYTLALTISMPLSMLPTIIGTTNFRNFASENTIKPALIKWTIILSVITLIGFILLIGPTVNILYDEAYKDVAYYSSLLAIGMIFHGFGDMYNRFLGAHGYGIALRNAAFITGFVLVTGNFVLVYYWGIYGAIATKIVSSVSYYFTTNYYYQKYQKDLNK